MTGTAYLTALRPWTDLGPFASTAGAAVYVLYPEWIHIGGITSHVIVSSHQRERTTVIFPADASGLIAEWDPIEEYPAILSHEQALLAAGYRVVHLEVPDVA